MRKWLGHHQEKSRTGQAEKRRQRRQKASGGWSLKVKRISGITVSDAVEGRRQMAAATGKKSSSSLSLFMAGNGLEVEEEISTMRTQHWAEGVWTGKWSCEQNEAWMRQIREVRTWKQGRGPAGASDV